MEDFVVRKQLAVRAPVRHVWHALTDPEMTRRYFYGCRVHSGWKVNDAIVFERKVFWIFPMQLRGKILKINRGTLLQYSLNNSRSNDKSIVTIELYEDSGKTIVSVSDDVGQAEGASSRYQRSLKGWDKILTGLKEVVETELNGYDR